MPPNTIFSKVILVQVFSMDGMIMEVVGSHCFVTSDPHGSQNLVDNLTNGDAMYVRTFLREMQNNNYP